MPTEMASRAGGPARRPSAHEPPASEMRYFLAVTVAVAVALATVTPPGSETVVVTVYEPAAAYRWPPVTVYSPPLPVSAPAEVVPSPQLIVADSAGAAVSVSVTVATGP